MANWHLDELLLALTAAGWNLVGTMPAPGVGIAEIWRLHRADAANVIALLEFHVDSDEENPDLALIENSYGCAVRYNPNLAVHFYKHRKDWDQYLREFIDELEESILENADEGRKVKTESKKARGVLVASR